MRSYEYFVKLPVFKLSESLLRTYFKKRNIQAAFPIIIVIGTPP